MIFLIDKPKSLKYFVSMNVKLDELEKAVSQVVKRISSLKKENAALRAVAEKRTGDGTSAAENRVRELEDENRRLLSERKDLRKRVRSIIRNIDKVKW